ncbi:MAG: Dam family site-specific DNA-(adenine-N6)-methyltransferase [Candidatus Eremiobacterota bacterium]
MRFLRYPGGKTKLLSFLVSYLPSNKDIKGKYIEPFVGGGSVFLYVQPVDAIIADLNQELIDLYKGIRNYPHKVWDIFKSFPCGKNAYYKIRDEDFQGQHLYYRAARILYLNRTCFKGMWRHNSNGNFNVGYGGEARRWVITHENIIDLSKRFRKAKIIHTDFEKTLSMCSSGDFIFLDPPYKPGEKDMADAHYINGRFLYEDQVRLASKLKKISQKKDIKWLMTNSSNPEICKLYKDFNIITTPRGTSEVVGVFKNNSREVLISNY